jgi:hypothetical protein
MFVIYLLKYKLNYELDCGTTHVAAPEVIKNQRYSEKADVYRYLSSFQLFF